MSRDRVTCASLVRSLDSVSHSPPNADYLALLRRTATARHARKLLDGLLAASSSPPPPLLDLDARLERAEVALARLAPVQSTSAASLLTPPPETVRAYEQDDPLLASDLADLAYLDLPPLEEEGEPLPSPPPRGSTSQSGDSSVRGDGGGKEEDRTRRKRAPSSAHAATSGHSFSPTTAASASTDLSLSPELHTPPFGTLPPRGPATTSSLDPTLTTSTTRQRRRGPPAAEDARGPTDSARDGRRELQAGPGAGAAAAAQAEKPVPAYLAAKRARAAEERERKRRLVGADAGDGEEGADRVGKKGADQGDRTTDKVVKDLDDLIPADSAPASGAGGGGGDLLGQHHALQTSLLSSLTSLSGALKQSTVTFSDNLAKDKEVVTRAQEQLETSETGMKTQQARLKEVRGKSRGTTCWTLGLLALVFFLWLLTFLLIKVT